MAHCMMCIELGFKFYGDFALNPNATFLHFPCSRKAMQLPRLMGFIDKDDDSLVHGRLRGLPTSKDTFEPARNICVNVTQLLYNLLRRNTTPQLFVSKASLELDLYGIEV